MVLPDINLLVYAYSSDAPFHVTAKHWWETTLSTPGAVGLPWVVALGFVRIMSSQAVFRDPMDPPSALSHVRSWLACPQVQIVTPGPRHLEIMTELMRSTRAPLLR